MRQSRTSRPVLSHLLPLLLTLALTARQRRTRERLLTLCLGYVQTLGRHTLTGVLRSLGRDGLDWSAAYRLFSQGRIDLEAARRRLLASVLSTLSTDDPLVVVLDGTQLARTSPRFPGVGWLRSPRTPVWRPGIHRAQRWVGLSALLPRSADGASRAVPLHFVPAPSPTARPWPEHPPQKEWEAGLAALGWLRTHLDGLGQTTRRVLAVADGSYSVAPLLRALPQGVSLLARTTRTRALYALPAAPQPGQRGRRRRYGERGPTPEQTLHARAGWRMVPTPVRGRTLHLRVHVSGPWLVKPAPEQPVFLLVVQGIGRVKQGRRGRREPAFLLVSAVRAPDGTWSLPLPVTELLAWAWQRWEVEVMHRELKSGFGLGQQQAWSPVAASLVIPWVVWLYATLMLAGYLAWGWDRAVRQAKWQRRRRWTARDVAQAVQQELWQLPGEAFPPVWATIRGDPPEMILTIWPMALPATAASRL
ncbi:MAG: transposase [Chloroflexota bacterium]|nr:transposase [Chloroflexota bacterium]